MVGVWPVLSPGWGCALSFGTQASCLALSPARADALNPSVIIFTVIISTSFSSHLLFCVPHQFAGILWAELWWVAFASTPAPHPPPPGLGAE